MMNKALHRQFGEYVRDCLCSSTDFLDGFLEHCDQDIDDGDVLVDLEDDLISAIESHYGLEPRDAGDTQ